MKGKEDLKQDERAMQLFSVVNSMVADRESDFHKNLSIQRYNVTPICSGKRIPAGLISYLENSRDVFNTIKEYREKISQRKTGHCGRNEMCTIGEPNAKS